MDNKPFHIDSNILKNKKKSSSVVKKNNTKKLKINKSFFSISIVIILLIVGIIFWIKDFSNDLIKDFSDGKIIVCKDRLISKELGYSYNKKENAFLNKKEGFIFTTYFCSNFDK